MAQDIDRMEDIKPGDFYEDVFFHPCVCFSVESMEVSGISLVDGTFPRAASIGVSGIRKLTLLEAWHWRLFGPIDAEIPPDKRWWRLSYESLAPLSDLELLSELIVGTRRNTSGRLLPNVDLLFILTALQTRTGQALGNDLSRWIDWFELSNIALKSQTDELRSLYKHDVPSQPEMPIGGKLQ
jgi:hypothetical protein